MNKNKIIGGLLGVVAGILIVVVVSFAIAPDKVMGAFSKYGLPGIYNDTEFELGDGQGSALTVDSNGRLVLSSSSTISVSSVGTTSTPVVEGHFSWLEARNTLFGALDGSGCIDVDSAGSATSTLCAASTATSTANGWFLVGDLEPRYLDKAQGELMVSNELEVRNFGWFSTGIITFDTSTISGLAVTSTDNTIDMLPEGSKYLRIGDAGFSNRSLDADDDLLISGELEADGVSWFETTVNTFGNLVMAADTRIAHSFSTAAIELANSNQTAESPFLYTGGTSNNWILGEYADRATDWGFTAFTDPTFTIVSNDSGDTTQAGHLSFSAESDYLSLTSRSGDFSFNNQGTSSTIFATSTAANVGGQIILEDHDGAGCTRIGALNGVLDVVSVPCTK